MQWSKEATEFVDKKFLHKKFGCFWDRKGNPRCLFCKSLLLIRSEYESIMDCPKCTPKYSESNPRQEGDERGWYPLRRKTGESVTVAEARIHFKRQLLGFDCEY